MSVIHDLKVGSTETVTLAVRSATARKTKAGKDYLALELFDGIDVISGNYWDWSSGKMPEVNSVIDATAQITEWQGVKQLSIKSLRLNSEVPIEHFAPQSNYDIESIYRECYALICDVKDDFLRDLALEILEKIETKWLRIPGAKSVHHAFVGGTLVHSYYVSKIANFIALTTPGANTDLCTVGAMLHDVGKLFTYKLDGTVIDMTDDGMLYDHIVIGAELVGNIAEEMFSMDDLKDRKLAMLRHIILSHHHQLDFGSPVTPASIEAHIVAHADAIDAAAEQIRVASSKVENKMWTDRIWALGNKPCLTTQYVEEVMRYTSV
jgi:3'-5' exoribonuclease